MPEPASTTSAKCFERPIGKESLNAGARHRVDVEEGSYPSCRRSGVNCASQSGSTAIRMTQL
jgi:hypothetical protein